MTMALACCSRETNGARSVESPDFSLYKRNERLYKPMKGAISRTSSFYPTPEARLIAV
jgi:hypothetical protein